MPRGRDEAGNIWELDAQGKPLRLVQPAQQSFPGSIPGAFVPPNPAKVAQMQREQARQDAADQRAERSDARAAAAAEREQKKFESEDTMAPPPGDVAKTGDEYLATIPPSLAGQVKALAEGRRAFPTGSALRSPAVQQLIAAATQYDPTLDATNAATRVATRKKFTSGTTRDNITAINTALGHLGTLWKDSQKLNNFGSPIVNAPVNAFESHILGDQRYTNFDLTRHAVVDELEKAFRGSGGTQTGIDEWKRGINSSQSPEQLRGAIGKAVELLSSRLDALGDAYTTGMGRSADPMVFLNPHAKAVFGALGPGGDGNVPDTPKDFGGSPPILGGSDTPPPAPPLQAPPAIRPPGGVPRADYSGMVGGPQSNLASGDTRNVFDPTTAAGMASLIRKGRPYEEAAAYAQSKGFPPPAPADYAAAVTFQKGHPNAQPNVEANRQVPVSAWQKFASGPTGAFGAGAADAATLGFNDEMAGGLSALAGGDYTQGRDAFNARKNILAETHPTANILGNMAGGAATALVGAPVAAGLASRLPGALASSRFAPLAGDAAYGAAYGAGENNENRLGGAVMGGLAGAGGGALGRSATRGLANVIAPPAGEFGPAYAQGVFPTIGQRFGRSGIAGRMINTAEQAMQSFPGLGAMVARARDIPRDAAQLGAFNESLGELAPFDQVLGRRVSSLPAGVQPGTEPHQFASQAFRDAYNTARSGMQFAPDSQYIAEHGAFNGVLNNGVLSAPQAEQVQRVINNAVGSRLPRQGGAMAGDAYQSASHDIGSAINTWARNPDTQPMANALSDYQTIFDNAARRNSNPQAVNLLDAADRGYARYARVRNASARVGGDPGTFTMKGLQRAVQQEGGGVSSGPFLRGEALMQPYSTAVQGLGDSLANSGTGERLLTNRMFLGEQAGAGAAGTAVGLPGALMAHPGALAPFLPYAPGINGLVTRAIAPREYTLPQILADPLIRLGQQTRNRAPLVGSLAAPAAVGWELQQ